MGNSRWSSSDWDTYTSSTTAHRSRSEVFSRGKIKPEFDPKKIEMRESRDSDSNPQSNAIIVAFDETGSMGDIPDAFVRKGLGKMVEEVLDRAPVTDPHVMIMGIGDAWCDQAPLQVTQFEADISIAEQLQEIYLEGHGGGNQWESYNLPWYFAARRTSIDCWEKRGKKGYLFTVGDEMPPPHLLASHVKKVLGEKDGEKVDKDMDTKDVLAMANRMYHVFHVVVEEGSFARGNPTGVYNAWHKLLGQRVLPLSDYTHLAECIVSAIEINEGRDVDDVTSSWSGDTSIVVAKAVKDLVGHTADAGVVRF